MQLYLTYHLKTYCMLVLLLPQVANKLAISILNYIYVKALPAKTARSKPFLYNMQAQALCSVASNQAAVYFSQCASLPEENKRKM